MYMYTFSKVGCIHAFVHNTIYMCTLYMYIHVHVYLHVHAGSLVYGLNTAALPLVVNETTGTIPTESEGTGTGIQQPPLLAALHMVLRHPSLAARMSGAWCVHCLGQAIPSQLSALLECCMGQLQLGKGSPSSSSSLVTSGYISAAASLLGTVRYSELGLPTSKAMVRLLILLFGI